MLNYLKMSLFLLALVVFSIGCSKVESPTGVQNEQQSKAEWTNAPLPGPIADASNKTFNEALEKAREQAGIKLNPKSGDKTVDFNFDQTYSSYSAEYGWLDIHVIDSDEIWGAGNQLQEVFLNATQLPGHIRQFSIVVPISQDNINTCYWNGGAVTLEYGYTDQTTGITGLKITFTMRNLTWVWNGWEYQEYPNSNFYFYRWIPGEQNYFPNMYQTNYAFIDNGGNSSAIGPYYMMVFGNEQAQTYSISGIAYYDQNGNGTQDNGETGIEGVGIDLSNGSSTTTAGDGSYSFADLGDGDYTVTAGDVAGKLHTTSATVNVTISGADGDANFGFDDIPTYNISGVAFFDVNGNGTQDDGEPGLGGQTVNLSGGGSTTTDGDGYYTFTELEAGNYTVSMSAISGFSSTTGLSSNVTLSDADGSANFGFAIDIGSFDGGSVNNAQGLGWWKENIRKAILGQTRGVQISAAALEALRASLSSFAYPALNYPNLTATYNALNYNGGNAASRLTQHFTASEYNYANGSLVNGDALATWALMVWGEFIVTNAGSYSNGYLNEVKAIFEGFNGGQI